jgi:hypothetical protein
MDFTVELSKDLIKDMDNIIENFIARHREDAVSIGALVVCLQALIDKRDEIQKIVEEGENE